MKVQNRNKETSTEIVKKHIHAGSIVNTDLWKGYKSINQEGYEHKTVNHFK